jgi:predicted DNA-binding transcriptional regulator AlpA
MTATEQLARSLEDMVRQMVGNAAPVIIQLPPEEVLSIPQMMKRLGIGKETAYEWASRPDFPVYDLGERQKRVVWSEVVAWVRKHRKEMDVTYF